ncbi:hypothetical protein GCM10011351_07590 [Paraliobacillus quinghaiensis]|uniref:Uncharacterized protein n=1 Tax=Paraliobacillus quinghaiensis TaxID=470815 RepID=A0A917WS39_9BACI|nr:J domain-containing protein [Paraliobacillus quinghaiensis]GGM24337.1 hypothetical protein GCM10011351_07590 [Paraliobacillus quinghaiensis]
MDIKTAYEILELPKDATLDDLEDRFIILIKREQSVSANNVKEELNADQINTAYRVLRDYLTDEEEPESKIGLKEKIEHFFRYYKLHVIGVLAIILGVGVIVNTVIDNRNEQAKLADQPPAALKIVLLGDYVNEDLTELLEDNLNEELTPIQEKIASFFPEWERIELDLYYSPPEVRSQTDIGMTIKNQVNLAQNSPDVLIVDSSHFKTFVANGSLLALDDLSQSSKDAAENNLLFAQEVDDRPEQLYGVNITDSSIFQETNLPGKKIAVIFNTAENYENALAFINETAKTLDNED